MCEGTKLLYTQYKIYILYMYVHRQIRTCKIIGLRVCKAPVSKKLI